MLFVAKIVCPVRDFKCFMWQMSGASPFALRRRESVRLAAASRPCVALTRASLWLLLAGDFLPEAVVCAVFSCVCWFCETCADLFCVQIYHGCVSLCYRVAFLWFLWVKIRKRRRRRAFSIFFGAFARLVMCFNPKGGGEH